MILGFPIDGEHDPTPVGIAWCDCGLHLRWTSHDPPGPANGCPLCAPEDYNRRWRQWLADRDLERYRKLPEVMC